MGRAVMSDVGPGSRAARPTPPTRSMGAPPRARTEAGRLARFLVVGMGGTAIDFLLLFLLKLAGLPTLAANSLSFSAGAVSNFTWNRLWTFPEARSRHWTLQLVQFLMVSLVGLALNDLVVLLLQIPLGTLFGHPAQGYLLAKVVATGVAVLWNYAGNRLWTFGEVGRPPRARKEAHGHAA
jgi:putative flippase GtrA